MGEFEAKRRPERPLPQSRAERMGRLGALALGIAGDAARGALRRAANGDIEPLIFNAANAERLRTTLAELRGAALKLGQLISLEGEDLLPAELSAILASLRDQADAMSGEQLSEVLQAELGRDWRARFTEFDAEPIAAASIGQVHAAVAADGRDLALKVQYPGVEKSIDGDVANLAALLRITRLLPPELELKGLVPEIRRELKREADYEREAANTERFRALVADDPVVFVPRVHRDLSTRRVLALDRVWALPIEDLRGAEHPAERRNRLATALVRLVFRELFEFRFMQTDPNFANYLFEPKRERVALLDFGSARRFPKRFGAAYGELVCAAAEGETRDVIDAGTALGFLHGDEGGAGRESFVDIARLFAEPLRARGHYDFGNSDLARRLRETSLFAYRGRQLSRPPTETLFLHRKLVGSFMLCAHIGARVDVGALYREWLRR